MKKLKYLIIVILMSAPFLTFAQHEIKINLSNVMIYEFNASYEFIIDDHVSIGALGGYVYGFPDVDNPNRYFYVGPEFRYYVAPKYGGDLFYFGFYSRFKNGGSDVTLTESGQPSNLPPGNIEYIYQTEYQEFNKLALGITVGSKWVMRNGFVFGFFGGFGRNLISNYSDEGFVIHEAAFEEGTYTKSYDRSGFDSESWDFRIGFNVGFRLGN